MTDSTKVRAFDIQVIEHGTLPPERPVRLPKGLPADESMITIVVDVGDLGQGRRLVDLVERFGEQVSREAASANAIIQALVPEPAAALRPAQLTQLGRSAEMFARLEQEFGFYTGPQVGDLAGSAAANRSATATRWRRQGRIFAISRAGSLYYPTFQFDPDGEPKAVVARVISVSGAAGDSGWVLGAWFLALNTYLADETAAARRPVDVMDADAGAVVAAAERVLDGGP